MNHRCLSVNTQFESDFTPNLIYAQSILIEDLNEDGRNELVVGTANGEILIYKGSLSAPLLKNSKPIGCITCMTFDTITSNKRKYLIVNDSFGIVYLYAVCQVRKRYASDISSVRSSQPIDWKLDLRLVYQTKLLINPKFVLITDLYGNGSKEMVIGYSDRSVRLYTWSSFAPNANMLSASSNLSHQTPQTSNIVGTANNPNNCSYPINESGRFVLEQTWELSEQIYSINLVRDFLNAKDLLVTQTSGRVVHCKLNNVDQQQPIGDLSTVSSSSSLIDINNPNAAAAIASSANMTSNNPESKRSSSYIKQQNDALNASEEIVNFYSEIDSNDSSLFVKPNTPSYLFTNVNFKKSNNHAFLLTMSGDIFFFKLLTQTNYPIKTPIWYLNLNLIVLRYFKFDIDNDGNDELIIATPDGQIYVINCYSECMCFDLGEPIKVVQLGFFSTDLSSATALSLIDSPNAFAELESSYQSTNQAFELALVDAQSISTTTMQQQQQNNYSDEAYNNILSIIFVSALTNKIGLVQTDSMLSNGKSKQPLKLRYRCENILSRANKFPSNLNPLIELGLSDEKDKNDSFEKIIHQLLYQFKSS